MILEIVKKMKTIFNNQKLNNQIINLVYINNRYQRIEYLNLNKFKKQIIR